MLDTLTAPRDEDDQHSGGTASRRVPAGSTDRRTRGCRPHEGSGERFAELRNAIMRLPGNPSRDDRAGLRHRLLHLEHTLMSARGSLDDVIIAIMDANDAVL